MTTAGFWYMDRNGGSPQYVETGSDSGAYSLWTPRDGIEARLVERAVDWVLNAAGAGMDAVERACRAALPGSRLELPGSTQDQFWHRVTAGLRGGAQTSAFFGYQRSIRTDRSSQGLVIDDTKSGSVDGFPGGQDGSVIRGRGPGGGGGSFSGGNCGGGGHGTAGGDGNPTNGVSGGGGPMVPAESVVAAVVKNSYTKESLSMGGGGGTDSDVNGSHGGSGGSGRVIVKNDTFIERTSRMLTGGNGNDSHAGGGSGGGYYALVRGDYILNSGVSVMLTGGNGGSRNPQGSGGNGRFTIFNTGAVTIDGTVTDGAQTFFQIYPAIPFGGILAM